MSEQISSRSSESRRKKYLASRKPRLCSRCKENYLPLGSTARVCDECRATPDTRCKRCKKVKPIETFSKDSSRPSGYFPWCMACQSTSTGKFQNPDAPLNGNFCPMCDTPVRGHSNRKFCSLTCKDKVSSIRNNFNMDVSTYRKLIAAQKGKCPLCLNQVNQWHIDHNHKTLQVTGPVCVRCNIGALASTYHDIDYVKRLLSYLEETPMQKLGFESLAKPRKNEIPSKLHEIWSWQGAERVSREEKRLRATKSSWVPQDTAEQVYAGFVAGGTVEGLAVEFGVSVQVVKRIVDFKEQGSEK